jgi:uncharacterized protein involved in exopolysaccharide biosynthesis
MSFSSLRALLVRRWYLTLAGLIATAFLAFGANIAVPVQYEAQSDVLLLPPTPRGNPNGSNPYLSLSGYQAFADIVARAMNDTAAVRAVQSTGVTDSFNVTRDLTTNGPVVLAKVAGAHSAKVVGELRAVVRHIPFVLKVLQDENHVIMQAQFTAQVITHPVVPAAGRKSQIRAVLVAIVAGLFGTALFVAVIDRIARRRRTRRVSEDRPTPAPEAIRPEPALAAHNDELGDNLLEAAYSGHSVRRRRPAVEESRPGQGG